MKTIHFFKAALCIISILCVTPILKSQNGTIEADEGLTVGNNTGTTDGTIRYTGTDFEGRKSGTWTSLTGGGSGSSIWSESAGEAYYLGNVGVNIANPVTDLHVAGAGESMRLSGSSPWMSFRTDSESNYGFLWKTGLDFVMGNSGPNPIRFRTNSSDRLIITGDGDFGIGTLTPSGKLHIDGGDTYITGSNPRLFIINDGDADSRVGFGNNGGSANDAAIFYDSSEDKLSFGTNTTSGNMHIVDDGKVGVNVSSSLTAQMSIRANAGNTVTPATLELMENNNSGYPVLKYSNFSVGGHFTNDANGQYGNFIGGDADFRIRYSEDGTTFKTIMTALYAYDDHNGVASNTKDERIGIRTEAPDADLHLFHKNGVEGHGFKIQHEGSNNRWWKFYVSDGAGTLALRNDDSPTSNVGTFAIDGVYTGSDVKLKNNIKELSYGINDIMKLTTKSYNYKTKSGSKKSSIGLIAQEVNTVVPEIVLYDKESDQYSVNYAATGVLAIKAIQDQQEIIDAQQAQIDELKNMVLELQSKID